MADTTTKAAMCDIGMYGLAVMGQNFALNLAEHGFRVAVCNRTPEKVDLTVARAREEGGDGGLPVVGFKDAHEFVQAISTPRRIILLVMAGKPVDDTIALLSAWMQPGDVLVDGGNEWFPNTIRRAKELEPKGILYVGMGISGGEEGARKGPALMPGGSPGAFDLIKDVLAKCAAQVSDGPCMFDVGGVGSGNYVKMVHNGIEYGDMQLIAEAYDILKHLGGLDNDELAHTFQAWNEGELGSFLVEITAKIFARADDLNPASSTRLIDLILDKTGMKGTGRWAVQEGAERSCGVSVIAAALDARYVSARKAERAQAAKLLQGPKVTTVAEADKAKLIDDVRQALYAAKIVSYAQGMNLIREISAQMKWNIRLSECARIWKGGCIIRARLLEPIQRAFTATPDLPNLLLDPTFAATLSTHQHAWRAVVAAAATQGVACPALAAALSYYDSYRRERLPANLTQAQRDYFGGHTYERVDKPGSFHCLWDTTTHHDIGDVTERALGNL